MEEDTSQALAKQHQLPRAIVNRQSKNVCKEAAEEDDEECDPQAWETLSKSFKDAQSVLDQNRVLIKQVNDNHRSKVPDNLVQNVALIRKINNNISKVMGIYSDLAVNFSSLVQERRSTVTKANNGGNGTTATNS